MTQQYQVAAKKGDEGKMAELLDAFRTKHSAMAMAMSTRHTNEQRTATTSRCTKTILSYPDVCARYNLDMESESSTTKIFKLVTMQVLKKFKPSKKEIKDAKAAELGGEAAAIRKIKTKN